jgi:hypothetical protein
MKKYFLPVLLAAPLMIALPCEARIGETLEECQTRYGILLRVNVDQSFHPEFPQYCFKLGDVNIRVRLYNGKSAQELFYCEGKLLTQQHVDEILESNRRTVGAPELTWGSQYMPGSYREDILVVTTKEFAKILHKEDGSGF